MLIDQLPLGNTPLKTSGILKALPLVLSGTCGWVVVVKVATPLVASENISAISFTCALEEPSEVCHLVVGENAAAAGALPPSCMARKSDPEAKVGKP
jgi:hypothetical protein